MLGSDEFSKIRSTSVGQNEEKVKSRVREIWLALQKPKREEVLNLSGLTVHAVTRTYWKGKISLKLALALAQTQDINPYYLSGASDDREGCTDERINQFLTDNGHAEAVNEPSPKRPKKIGVKTAKVNSAAEPTGGSLTSDSAVNDGTASAVSDFSPSEELPSDDNPPQAPAESVNDVEEKIVQPYSAPASTQAAAVKANKQAGLYDNLISTIQEKVRAVTEAEQEKLDAMSAEAAEQLLKGLLLRTEYSGNAKRLASLVKMLLVM